MPKMNTESFTKEPVLEADLYPAELVEVNEYEKDYGEGPVQKLAWVFKVTASKDAVEEDPEGTFDGTVEIALHTSYATGKNSKFKSTGLKDVVPEDWDGDTDSLIGMEVTADVVQFKGQDGSLRNGIDKVRPPKKGKKAKAAPKNGKDDVTIDESDFEDIPL